MALVEVQVPDIGDFDEVTVIELMVKVGDTVKAEQSLITVESDKASMEIPSSTAGVVTSMRVALGDKVKQGSIVLVVEAAGAAGATGATAAPAAAVAAPVAAAVVPVAVAAAPSAATAAGPVQVHVTDIGDFKDVVVIEVMVKPGDSIKVEQSLITVESDKASMEIPSSHAGVLKELKVKVGDKVNIGDLLAVLEGVTAGVAAPAAAAAAVASASVPSNAPAAASVNTVAVVAAAPAATAAPAAPAHAPGSSTVGLPHASPSVRKFARELGVPLDEVKGNGPKGRI
ncbi:MAG: Dihydrolipoyllysine-residue acetyltransferase component of pyruvate dehydrogenase complex, partial [Pseudomonadota bacterium]